MSSETFVEQLYRKFLFREPDETGKAYWVNKLDTGEETAAQVTYNFALSSEYSSRAQAVSQLYFLLFERVPDSAGMQYWLDNIDQGLSTDSLVELFMASEEYADKYSQLDDDQFLTELVAQSTGQSPDQAETAAFREELNSGGQAALIRYLTNYDEFHARHDDSITKTSLYYGVLNRSPTTEELIASPVDNIELLNNLYSHTDYTGAALPQSSRMEQANTVSFTDALQSSGITINGAEWGGALGLEASDAGDMNGDGVSDFIIMGRDKAYLIFGDSELATNGVDLSNLDGNNGTVIEGSSLKDITAAGDINGDGFDDVVINNRSLADGTEQAVLLFGQSETWQPVLSPFDQAPDSTAVDATAFIHTVENPYPLSFSGIGDVNGDGIDDLFISSADPLRATDDQSASGRMNIIYGHEGDWQQSFDLSSFDNTQGTLIEITEDQTYADITAYHHGVNPVGDLNNDGIDDLVIPKDQFHAGDSASATILFGQSGGWDSPVYLNSSTATESADITTEAQFRTPDSAGDFNGDGLADVMFSIRGTLGTNVVDIVFGNENSFSQQFSTEQMASNSGLTIIYSGSDAENSIFQAISLGDINNDGNSDILVNKSANAENSQELYVIYGHAPSTSEVIDLFTLTEAQGLRLQNTTSIERDFDAVSAVGDVNGDGYSDFIASDITVDLPDLSSAGQAYLIFGNDQLFG